MYKYKKYKTKYLNLVGGSLNNETVNSVKSEGCKFISQEEWIKSDNKQNYDAFIYKLKDNPIKSLTTPSGVQSTLTTPVGVQMTQLEQMQQQLQKDAKDRKDQEILDILKKQIISPKEYETLKNYDKDYYSNIADLYIPNETITEQDGLFSYDTKIKNYQKR